MQHIEEHIELFENYLSETLDEAARLDFELRLAGDPDFAQSFEKYKLLESDLRQHYRQKLKNKLNEIDQQLDQKTNRKKSLLFYLIPVAAAAAVIVLVWLNSGPDNTQLAQAYWPHEEGLPVKMSDKAKYDDATNQYKLKNWNEAEKLFSVFTSDTAMYFLGEINYQQNDWVNALDYFSRVPQNSVYAQTAQFKISLIHLINGKTGEAKKIWTEISTNPQNCYYNKAVELLDVVGE